MANYKKNSDGYYRATIPTDEYKDGRPVYKQIRSKTLSGLKEKIDKYKKDKALCINSTDMTVDEWERVWFNTYKGKCRDNTKNFYTTLYTKHISPEIGCMKIGSVIEVNCQQILNKIADKHLSVKTSKDIRSLLFSLFDKAEKNHLIAFNPAKALSVSGAPSKSRRALTKKERSDFLSACKTEEFGTFASFLYWFGLRRGECLALTKSDIGTDYITVNKQYTYPNNNSPVLGYPKTNAGIRTIPIPDKAREYIDFDNLKDGLLFCNYNGAPLSYSQQRDKWNCFITKALGEDTEITIHYLRHNYATMLCEAGVPVTAIQRYCGHDDIATTMGIYQHFSQTLKEQSDDIVKALGADNTGDK